MGKICSKPGDHTDNAGSLQIKGEATKNSTIIRVVQGNIADESVDIIVNAANENLKHGGEVAGKIVQKGGVAIQQESNQYIKRKGRVPPGGVAITGPGNLDCQKIIHAVGPIWNKGENEEAEILRKAILNSLMEAEELNAKSIAFPAIATGMFGYPKDQAAIEIFSAFMHYISMTPDTKLKEIRVTIQEAHTLTAFIQAFEKKFEVKYPADK